MRRWGAIAIAAAAATLAACIGDVKVTEHPTGSSSSGGGMGSGGQAGGCAAGPHQCALGAACATPEDCVAGACVDARCQPPTQGAWTMRNDGNAPSPRSFAAMAYDPVGKRVVLFGGKQQGGMPLADSWALTSQGWSLPVGSGAPPPARYAAVLAYDTKAAQMVLYGGASVDASMNPVVLADTWGFAGGAWASITSGTPTGRQLAGAAWDSDKKRLVMFGGSDDQTGLDEMWSYQAQAWTPLPATSLPPEPIGPAMAYDGARRVLVAFGGVGAVSDTGGAERTWTFDGAWKDASPVLGPPRRAQAQMVYDARRRRVVLHGGTYLGFTRGDTWEWDGATWTRTSNDSALQPVGATLVYDDAGGRVLAFGGDLVTVATNALFEYRGWANACASDDGCDGGIHCVDGLCCLQDACNAGEACNVPASPGTCTKVATP